MFITLIVDRVSIITFGIIKLFDCSSYSLGANPHHQSPITSDHQPYDRTPTSTNQSNQISKNEIYDN